ncbi:MAG: response regulator [Candidatus Omnitrophota bacterium]
MKKILIVDDDPDIIELVKSRLEVNNFEVVTACDGQQAIDVAQKENPALIILDVMMPKMDGFKACGLLKRNSRFANTPIIMLTAKAQDEDLELGKELGADAYLPKPFRSEILLEKINELLGR